MPTSLDLYESGNYICLSKDRKFEFFSLDNIIYKIHRDTGFVSDFTKYDEEILNYELQNS